MCSCPGTKPCCADLLLEMMTQFSAFLRTHNATHMLAFGRCAMWRAAFLCDHGGGCSLLGSVRSDDLIPWTNDVDIAVPPYVLSKLMVCSLLCFFSLRLSFTLPLPLTNPFTRTLCCSYFACSSIVSAPHCCYLPLSPLLTTSAFYTVSAPFYSHSLLLKLYLLHAHPLLLIISATTSVCHLVSRVLRFTGIVWLSMLCCEELCG